MLKEIPSKEDIINAANIIKEKAHRTPILSSSAINSMFACTILFKCENFQKAGAFKFRGAYYTLRSLNRDELKKGVATHSSGNHAAALALSAKLLNSKAYIVMPETAPQIKKDAVRSYNAEIYFCQPTLKSRIEKVEEVISKTGATLIHPYDNYSIIAGQATCAFEVFDEVKDADYIIAPVGGGGLLSGTSLSAKYFSKSTKVIGAEPEGADDAFRSIRDGFIHPSVNPKTICDGLLTQLSDRTFNIIRNNVDRIFTCSDQSVIESMRLIWERMKIIVEPSAAITLAAIRENQMFFERKKVVCILSGGNLDLNRLPWNS
ncbi:pyridoxal-phosphate dependent enzyme [Melioribacter sp. OK-6-Me]|uniref:pyridoxal-phosphate dependent enzyme n=1 Tax=unclassified Melioribacter TaxID=2627329 RepID=UPI003EDA2E0F